MSLSNSPDPAVREAVVRQDLANVLHPIVQHKALESKQIVVTGGQGSTLTWPSTRRWRAAKAETVWIGALASFLPPDRRTVLPSTAMTPVGMPVIDATQATKQR